MMHLNALHFSNYNQLLAFIVFAFKHRIPIPILEFARASSLLVALGVGLVYAIHGYGKIKEFYCTIPMWFIPIWDFTNHLLPLILVGIPQSPWSLPIAYCVLLTWFVKIRQQIELVYIKGIAYDEIMIGLGCFVSIYSLSQAFTLPPIL
jgi:hypothetical protein